MNLNQKWALSSNRPITTLPMAKYSNRVKHWIEHDIFVSVSESLDLIEMESYFSDLFRHLVQLKGEERPIVDKLKHTHLRPITIRYMATFHHIHPQNSRF